MVFRIIGQSGLGTDGMGKKSIFIRYRTMETRETIDAKGFTYAALDGNIDKVKRGLALGLVDIRDEGGQTAMIMAARGGKIDIVKLLISEGGKLDIQSNSGATAMSWAASNGDIDIVKLLISEGANPSLKDKDGMSAMDYVKEMHPSKVNEVEVSRLLITKFHRFLYHRESRNFHC